MSNLTENTRLATLTLTYTCAFAIGESSMLHLFLVVSHFA